MKSKLDRLLAIEPVDVDGEMYWPRDKVLTALGGLNEKKAKRIVAAHPGASERTLKRGSGRHYTPVVKYSAVNLTGVLAICTMSGITVPLNEIRRLLERRLGGELESIP